MKCAVHSDVDAVGYCRNCGKAMCSTCVRPVRDVLYCEECLATIVGIPAPTPVAAAPPAASPYQMPASGLPPASPSHARSSPVLAFFLGFLPGMGAFYNEQYGKGMIHLAIFLVLFITGIDGSMSGGARSEEHTSELQSHSDLVCRLLLEKKKNTKYTTKITSLILSH